jgi:hypothetical protein
MGDDDEHDLTRMSMTVCHDRPLQLITPLGSNEQQVFSLSLSVHIYMRGVQRARERQACLHADGLQLDLEDQGGVGRDGARDA